MAATVFDFAYQMGDAFAFLVLCASGLAVIFGMMGVINLAHGEFIMCGAYVTVAASRIGLPLPLAILLRGGGVGGGGDHHRTAGRPAAVWPAAGHHRCNLGHQPDRRAGHIDPARAQPVRHRHAARQRNGRGLLLLGLSPRSDGGGRAAAGRALSALQFHAVRHAGPGDDSGAPHGRGARGQHQLHLQPDVRPGRRAGRRHGWACTRRP